METESLKQPYSLEAEQSLLGSVIIDPPSMNEIVSAVQPKYFFLPLHRMIFSCLMAMFETARPIDAVTLLDEMKKSPEYDDSAGRQYILQLADSVPTSRHIKSYAKIVRDKYYLRTLIDVSGQTIEEASDAASDAETVIDAAEQRIMNIRGGRSGELKPIREIIGQTMDYLGKISGDDKSEFLGIPTGFSTLDNVLTGLHRSDMIIVAARPGIGKSSFAMNVAQNVAKQNKAVVVFSLEMSADQLITRMLSTEALIDNKKLRSGEFKNDDWSRIVAAVSALYNIPMYIDDSADITVPEMKAKLRRVKNLGLVIVDYLQLMTGTRRTDSRVNEVAEITRGLKIMAKELNVPLIALSQMSRDVDKRKGENSTPVLSDLRESGSIEQDADIVIFLHPENAHLSPEERPESIDMKVLVEKNRHGERAALRFKYVGKYTKFTPVTEIYTGDEPY